VGENSPYRLISICPLRAFFDQCAQIVAPTNCAVLNTDECQRRISDMLRSVHNQLPHEAVIHEVLQSVAGFAVDVD
jgi:hypothetical protein